MRMRFGSVRARTAFVATLVVAVALVAAGASVLLAVRENLSGQAEHAADSAARRVATSLVGGTALDSLDLDGERPVQVVGERGELLAVSEDLEHISGTGSDAVRPQRTPRADSGEGGDGGDDDSKGRGRGEDGGGGHGDDDLGGGEVSDDTTYLDGSATVDGDSTDYRFAKVRVDDTAYGDLTVYAGAPSAAGRGAVAAAATAMLIGFPVLLLVVGGATWLLTRRALRPVEGIRREMASITAAQDLARRVPEPDTRDEVARLARTTNETLAALEESVERQRRFVADASHELRSPIASLRTQLEVGFVHPELLDVEGAVEDTVRLQELAADLLLLARLDAGERPGGGQVDLAAMVREEVSQRVGDRVKVVVDEHGPSGHAVGSRGQLARVLGNLLDNAQRHARSLVRVGVRGRGPWVVLTVADDGDGVPESERERVFERFVRLDDARSRDGGGAGLGLAIARDVTARHGGTLSLRAAPEGGALFELRLPACREP